ncbi:glycosyltransferase [Cellulomonas marina]|uniref:Glycosyltransferase like family 2 n=1 Tax=Cellulomonas marina TaxID=988821 RepID=A0A1I0YHP8_9CELL|nr:glycosyltransferase [Cellulomonas marina]GIG28736.1 hypothetical protein Cma02nite_13360 [Cellulomonas marina]SFB11693.1 Glycosyltransferase like family 2 [Cellulomonas marina]
MTSAVAPAPASPAPPPAPSAHLADALYVLPLRWTDDEGLAELTAYLAELGAHLPVVVVDGSPPARWAAHADAWRPLVAGGLHRVPPAPWPGANGKVAGVMTGVHLADRERLVLADDDVRWDRRGLERALALLDDADVVRPQNHFDPLPWHTLWDTGRTLLNRAFGSDYPGTLVVRRSVLLRAGGYDGDVLFENLELLRTVVAAGGREHRADDLLVRRLPPTARHFLGQRVRQAYDSQAQPARLAAELAVLPALLAARRRPGLVAVAAAAVVAVAERGRRRAGGGRVLPARATLLAPAWLLERGVCAWWALALRARGGVPYAGGRLRRAATPTCVLAERLRDVRDATR